MVLKFLLLFERNSAQAAGAGLVLGVGPPDVAVVRGVGGEGLPAVLALEGPLPGVLADVCAQDAGGGEGLQERSTGSVRCICFATLKFTVSATAMMDRL